MSCPGLREAAQQALTAAEGSLRDFVERMEAVNAMTPAPEFDPRSYLKQARRELAERASTQSC